MNPISLSHKQFDQLTRMIYESCGISLHEGKQELLKSKLAKRMRQTGKDLEAYLEYLQKDKNEIVEFIDTVTTNHSFFFRENQSLAYIANRLASTPGHFKGPVSIWSAACSTGDEPYSFAMQLDALGIDFSILATDISHTALAFASQGVYKTEKVNQVPLHLLHRYFQKGSGQAAGYVRIKKKICNKVCFRLFNLVTDLPPSKPFDIIVLRNVMIYFDQSVCRQVVDKLYQCLRPEGYFVIGNAESLMNLDHKFKPVNGRPGLYIK